MTTPLEELNSAILCNDLCSCKRLCELIPDRFDIKVRLLTDSNLIKFLRDNGWTVTVSPWFTSVIIDLMDVKTVADNIQVETESDKPFEAIIRPECCTVIEYLNLRGIPYSKLNESLFSVRPRISWEDAVQNRGLFINYLHHYHLLHCARRGHHSQEFLDLLLTLTPNEIIQSQQCHLIPILIELKVKLPTTNQVLTVLLDNNQLDWKMMIPMFSMIAEYNRDSVDHSLVGLVVEGLNNNHQYGGLLIVIVRYNLANLDEYREIPFINHLLEIVR